jgi:hypothetical protein
MRHRSLRWFLLSACISAWPLVANAGDLSDAQKALEKGDLHAAQIHRAMPCARIRRIPRRIMILAECR